MISCQWEIMCLFIYSFPPLTSSFELGRKFLYEAVMVSCMMWQWHDGGALQMKFIRNVLVNCGGREWVLCCVMLGFDERANPYMSYWVMHFHIYEYVILADEEIVIFRKSEGVTHNICGEWLLNTWLAGSLWIIDEM